MFYKKKYWSNLYNKSKTEWDINGISTPIKEYIDQLKDKSLKILIPGAGNAYEAEYLHKKGFTEVYILDFADEPIENFKKRVPDFPLNHIIQTDFFTFTGNFDLIIEQTFFSSLYPTKRALYVNKIQELLQPKGKLVGLLFKIDFKNNFPPFGGSKEIYLKLFKEQFIINTLEISYNSIKPRRHNELFIILIAKDVEFN